MRGILDMIGSRIGQKKKNQIFEQSSFIYFRGIKEQGQCVVIGVSYRVMLSRDTDKILALLRICPTTTIMDILYSYAAFVRIFHHYKIHATLYLMEKYNSQST